MFYLILFVLCLCPFVRCESVRLQLKGILTFDNEQVHHFSIMKNLNLQSGIIVKTEEDYESDFESDYESDYESDSLIYQKLRNNFHSFNKLKAPLPNLSDKATVMALGALASGAYHQEGTNVPPNEHEPDTNSPYFNGQQATYIASRLDPLPWQQNSSYGWKETQVRGHIYTSDNGKLIILSIKGTSPPYVSQTGSSDKLMNNQLFSCCCGRFINGKGVAPACSCYSTGNSCSRQCLIASLQNHETSYFIQLQAIFKQTKELYGNKHSSYWFVGHSLGGALSSFMTLAHPETAAIAFQSPGEASAAKRLGLWPPLHPHVTQRIFHLATVRDPIFTGDCRGGWTLCYLAGYAVETKCHIGRECLFERNATLDHSLWSHRLLNVLKAVIAPLEKMPECEATDEECEDCEEWQFS